MITVILSLALLGYLLVVMVRPEWF
ncbi:MAG: potassium-transporting ATPase subunit F [Verrucomicrobiales bacterium]|nr:potassium-transporting ATPase subunit F [Verrucomicrobiales bacterium]